MHRRFILALSLIALLGLPTAARGAAGYSGHHTAVPYIVVLDAGHGGAMHYGDESGAPSADETLLEKTMTLTVARLANNRCTIALIPHTIAMTNLGSLKAGDPVNLEADLIAKYVEKMMKGEATASSFTIEDLVEQGF